VLSMEVLYHLNHTSSTFCSDYLGYRVFLFVSESQSGLRSSSFKIPAVAGLTVIGHYAPLFSVENGISQTIC
jgi:hypothetical protein